MQNQEENNMPTYTVTVADSTGDTQVQMTRPEIVATAAETTQLLQPAAKM